MPSSGEDILRLKIGHLARVFYPREMMELERTPAYFEQPINELKETIIERVPEMERIFGTYLNNMIEWEVVPGKVRYQIEGLAEELRAKGLETLTVALSSRYGEKERFHRLLSIMKMGLLSNEFRMTHGMQKPGFSVRNEINNNIAIKYLINYNPSKRSVLC